MDFSRFESDELYNNGIKDYRPRFVTFISLCVIAIILAYFCISVDPGALAAARWLLVIVIISIATRPGMNIRNLKFCDEGFSLAFGLGLALSFFTAWFISAVFQVEYGDIICFSSLVFLIIVCILLSRKSDKESIKKINKYFEYTWDKEKIYRYICGIALFSLFFFMAFWVIGFNPLLDNTTENYMDYGFMQAMYRQRLMAPMDIWYAGNRLNYYYLGQAAAVYMCRLAFTSPEYGYNLMLATFWAATATMLFEIVSGVADKITGNKKSSIVSGIIACLLGAFGANGHWIVYGIIYPLWDKLNAVSPDYEYWFPDGTVYISTENGDIDNGKNEFPAYSAILGDLHAHVINVIFVLPLIALVLDYMFDGEDEEGIDHLLLISILLGLFKGTNYWDFVIYFVVTGGVVVFTDLCKKGLKLRTLGKIILKAAGVTAISTVVILPFTLSFQKIASAVKIANAHSPLLKMLLLWGLPFFLTIAFIVIILKREDLRLKSYNSAGLLALSLCTLGLVVTPEVVYVEDIYGDGYSRFNIMFKLTYEAFILFAILIGILSGILASRMKTSVVSEYAFIFIAVLSLARAAYTFHALGNWMGDVFETGDRDGISTIIGLARDESYQAELAAAAIINDDNRKIVNIIEAAGNSYTHENALSVLTGGCAIAGWYVHEWLWRGSPDGINERNEEISNFYQLGDEQYCMSIIDKYDIDYIFVGQAENNRYNVDSKGFINLGELVYQSSDGDNDYILIRCKQDLDLDKY